MCFLKRVDENYLKKKKSLYIAPCDSATRHPLSLMHK